MTRVFYWVYIQLFGLPCRIQVLEALIEDKKLSPSITGVAADYAMGWDLKYTAIRHNITRERVRQYLFKAVRQ